MSLLTRMHDRVFDRRVRVLSRHIAELVPDGASVLDVGAGDGLIGKLVMECKPGTELEGIDVLVRPQTHIPVREFDGVTISHGDNSFDVVLFVDVLHHTDDPMILLREAARVARRAMVIKDHTQNGLLAGPTLRFMDWVGNAHHGVALPYNYWPQQRWHEAFKTLGLTIEAWHSRIGLYPPPASWVFERSLHFVARLGVAATETK